MMWWSDGVTGYWSGPWMPGPILMVLALIFGVAVLAMIMRGMMGGHKRRDALDVLKERFARGDITQSEYEERRRVLEA